ncbi:MAG: L,D-transpeptidase family protein [Acidimicrobiales bacterium]
MRRAAMYLVVVAALLVGAAAGAWGYRVIEGGGPARSQSPGAAPGAEPASGHPASSSSTTTTAATPIEVSSIAPADSALTGSRTPITVTFSSEVASASPLPSILPAVAGSWRRSGASLTFTPSVGYLPSSRVTLSIPGGPAGIEGTSGGRLGSTFTQRFRLGGGSVFRLQQLLSLLDYSPLRWAPAGAPISSKDAPALTAALFRAPRGTFSWRQSGWPARLEAMWRPGVDNVFTKGLVMSFEADHGLSPDGAVDPALWSSLDAALAANEVNTGGYNYALADKTGSEAFSVYHDGTVVLRSPANTGIADSPTPDGTFPVYSRLREQVMRGQNPSGSHYADLVQYVAYFKGNDAVHYMDRADFGIPQSLGCVELPLADAARAWPFLAYGTLVTVTG